MASTSSVDSTFPAVYFYVHDYRMEASNCKELSKFCGYAYHAGELPFVFSNGPNQGYHILLDFMCLLRRFKSNTMCFLCRKDVDYLSLSHDT